jgi:translation initiation factor SUI1
VKHRKGTKYETVISCLPDDLDLDAICKSMKKHFHCNGSVKADKDDATKQLVILQGDHHLLACEFLFEREIAVNKDDIIIHKYTGR